MSGNQQKISGRRGRTLKLYLADGTPSGVITAELGISSLRAAVASRTSLPELIRRDKAARTGIYLLVGPDPALAGRYLVYVGEGDQVKTRLSAHDSDDSKDFFTKAVLIVSKDENLTKAHGRSLESRVIAAIRDAGRAKLVNGTEPPFKGLPEPEIADMERVLDEIEVLLPVLGFDLLRPAGQEAAAPTEAQGVAAAPMPQTHSTDIFTFTEAGTNAKAREGSGEFVVFEGSLARNSEVPSCDEGVRRRRAQLTAENVLRLTEDGKQLVFAKDTAFDSSSRAACVVYGGSVSGPQYWKHQTTGQSYKDWRLQRLAMTDVG